MYALFFTTRHEKVKKFSNMVFSALRVFFSGSLEWKYERTCIKCLKPAVLLFCFGSYEYLWNNLHADWWSSVCEILFLCIKSQIPAGIYLLKVNKRNTRTRCEICSKLTINNRPPGVVLVYLLTLTYFTPCSSVSFVNFQQVNAGWDIIAHKAH